MRRWLLLLLATALKLQNKKKNIATTSSILPAPKKALYQSNLMPFRQPHRTDWGQSVSPHTSVDFLCDMCATYITVQVALEQSEEMREAAPLSDIFVCAVNVQCRRVHMLTADRLFFSWVSLLGGGPVDCSLPPGFFLWWWKMHWYVKLSIFSQRGEMHDTSNDFINNFFPTFTINAWWIF